jgi:hypothetical protein
MLELLKQQQRLSSAALRLVVARWEAGSRLALTRAADLANELRQRGAAYDAATVRLWHGTAVLY